MEAVDGPGSSMPYNLSMLNALYTLNWNGLALAAIDWSQWQGWHLWILIGFAIIILEMLTSGFVLGCVALGAFAAAAVDAFGFHGIDTQLWTVTLVTFASLLLLRPFVLRMSRGTDVDSNIERFVGDEIRIVESDPTDNVALAKLGGEMWRIQSQDGRSFQVGDRAIVMGVDGNKLIVEPLEAPLPTE